MVSGSNFPAGTSMGLCCASSNAGAFFVPAPFPSIPMSFSSILLIWLCRDSPVSMKSAVPCRDGEKGAAEFALRCAFLRPSWVLVVLYVSCCGSISCLSCVNRSMVLCSSCFRRDESSPNESHLRGAETSEPTSLCRQLYIISPSVDRGGSVEKVLSSWRSNHFGRFQCCWQDSRVAYGRRNYSIVVRGIRSLQAFSYIRPSRLVL